jgi:hypothetical protein
MTTQPELFVHEQVGNLTREVPAPSRPQPSSVNEFIKWFRARGEPYASCKLKTYTDGEPYFSSQGAEFSFSDFLKRRNELIGKPVV